MTVFTSSPSSSSSIAEPDSSFSHARVLRHRVRSRLDEHEHDHHQLAPAQRPQDHPHLSLSPGDGPSLSPPPSADSPLLGLVPAHHSCGSPPDPPSTTRRRRRITPPPAAATAPGADAAVNVVWRMLVLNALAMIITAAPVAVASPSLDLRDPMVERATYRRHVQHRRQGGSSASAVSGDTGGGGESSQGEGSSNGAGAGESTGPTSVDEVPTTTATPVDPTSVPEDPSKTVEDPIVTPTSTPDQPTVTSDTTPSQPTTTPGEPTTKPDNLPDAPTASPEEPTTTPVEPTVKPVDPTTTPDLPTVKPVDPTTTPDLPTVKPVDPTTPTTSVDVPTTSIELPTTSIEVPTTTTEGPTTTTSTTTTKESTIPTQEPTTTTSSTNIDTPTSTVATTPTPATTTKPEVPTSTTIATTSTPATIQPEPTTTVTTPAPITTSASPTTESRTNTPSPVSSPDTPSPFPSPSTSIPTFTTIYATHSSPPSVSPRPISTSTRSPVYTYTSDPSPDNTYTYTYTTTPSPSYTNTVANTGGVSSKIHSIIWPSDYSLPVNVPSMPPTYATHITYPPVTSAPGMHWSSYLTTETYTTTYANGETSVITTVSPTGTLVPDNSSAGSNDFKRNSGAIAGVTLGSLALLLLVAGGAFLMIKRHSKLRDADAKALAHASFGATGPSAPNMAQFGASVGPVGLQRGATLRGQGLLGEVDVPPVDVASYNNNNNMAGVAGGVGAGASGAAALAALAAAGASGSSVSSRAALSSPVVPGGPILSHAEMESIASEDGHGSSSQAHAYAGGAGAGNRLSVLSPSSAGHGQGPIGSLSSLGHMSDAPLVNPFAMSDDGSHSHSNNHGASGGGSGGGGSGGGNGSGSGATSSGHGGSSSSVPWWQATAVAAPVKRPSSPEGQDKGFRASLRARLRTASGKLLTGPTSSTPPPMASAASPIRTANPFMPPRPRRVPSGEWDDDMPPPGGLSPRPPGSPTSSAHGHGDPSYTNPNTLVSRRISIRPPVTPLYTRVGAPQPQTGPQHRGGALPTRAGQPGWGDREWPAPHPGLTLPPAVDASPAASAYTPEGLLDPRLTGTAPLSSHFGFNPTSNSNSNSNHDSNFNPGFSSPFMRATGGMASSTSFADAVDYSRPIGAYVAHRGYSSRTFGSSDIGGGSQTQLSVNEGTVGHDHGYGHGVTGSHPHGAVTPGELGQEELRWGTAE